MNSLNETIKALQSSLEKGLKQLKIELDIEQIEQLLLYVQLLEQWNKAYNLTAVNDPKDMIGLHLLDSLAILPHLKGKTFIDIGTGPGLPGIPLAIACPQQTFTLLDSNGKRTRFLFQVKTALGLHNVEEVHSRSENHQSQQGYDGVISRAFTSLADMVHKSQHCLAPQGAFYAMKGRFPEKELSELPKPYTVSSCYPLQVPGVEGERHLIEICASSRDNTAG